MASLLHRARAAVKLPLKEVDAERLRWMNEGQIGQTHFGAEARDRCWKMKC